jgi:nucleotide-binding universal stress UspA family protein
LYSTDLSDSSSKAFEYAIYLAKKTGADVHLLHVVEKLSSDAKITFQSYVIDNNSRHDMLKERVHHAEDALELCQTDFWNSLCLEDLQVRNQIKSFNVVEAYPAETILKFSRDLKVDLIVMGTHEKGILHTFLGSVAKNVLSKSRIPMMIVPLPKEFV